LRSTKDSFLLDNRFRLVHVAVTRESIPLGLFQFKTRRPHRRGPAQSDHT